MSKWRAAGLTTLYCSAFLSIGMVQGVLGPVLAQLARQAGVSDAAIGTLVLVRSCGWLVGSAGAGVMLVRVDGHRVMGAAFLGLCVAHAAIPLCGALAPLLALFCVVGVCGGALETTGNTLLLWLWRGGVAPYQQLLQMCIGAGAVGAPLVLEALLLSAPPAVGVRLVLWFMALLFVPPAFVVPWLATPRAQCRDHEDAEEEEEVKEEGRTTDAQLGTNWPVVVATAVMLLVVSGIEVATGSFADLFACDTFRAWTVADCAWIPSAFYAAFTASRLVCATLALRLLPQGALCALLLALLAAGALGLGVALALHSGAAVAAAAVAVGLGLGPLFALALGYSMDAPVAYVFSARDVAVCITTSNAGELLVPLVVSGGWALLGPRSFAYTVIALSAAAAVSMAALQLVTRAPPRAAMLVPLVEPRD